jgi:hypothetical protein
MKSFEKMLSSSTNPDGQREVMTQRSTHSRNNTFEAIRNKILKKTNKNSEPEGFEYSCESIQTKIAGQLQKL